MMTFEREKSSGYMINWAARMMARAIDRRLKGTGISSGCMPVIFALGNGAALSQKQLAEMAAIEQPTMAATLSRMERDGLIRRRTNPDDRRSALVSLTAEAMAKTQKVREAGQSVNARALADFSEEERALFLAMLKRVVDALADD